MAGKDFADVTLGLVIIGQLLFGQHAKRHPAKPDNPDAIADGIHTKFHQGFECADHGHLTGAHNGGRIMLIAKKPVGCVTRSPHRNVRGHQNKAVGIKSGIDHGAACAAFAISKKGQVFGRIDHGDLAMAVFDQARNRIISGLFIIVINKGMWCQKFCPAKTDERKIVLKTVFGALVLKRGA